MTAHSRLWFAHNINDKFDCVDGLGAARLQRRFTPGIRRKSPPNIMQISTARRQERVTPSCSTRYVPHR